MQRFAQNESGLRLRTIVSVNHQQNAIDHLHDPFDFATEIGVAGRVYDIDTITVPLKRRDLRPNGNALLALEIHRVHHPLLDFLIRPKSP